MASLVRRSSLAVANRLNTVVGIGRTSDGLGSPPSPLVHPRPPAHPPCGKLLLPAAAAPLGVRAYSNKGVSKWKAAGAVTFGLALLALSVPVLSGLILASVAVAVAAATATAAVRLTRILFPPARRPTSSSSSTTSSSWPWSRDANTGDVTRGLTGAWPGLGDGTTARLYDTARTAVLTSPLVGRLLGGTLEASLPQSSSTTASFVGFGAFVFPFGSGRAATKEAVALEFVVSGADGSAMVVAEGEAEGDAFRLTRLVVAPRGWGRAPIDLLQEEPEILSMRHVASSAAAAEDGGHRQEAAAAPPLRPGVRRATPMSRHRREPPPVEAEYRELK
eukprot:jgi/Mesvir1/4025/Mv05822-RA.1